MPSGIVSTSWPSVRDKSRDLGVEFDPWQDGAGRLILAKRADGKLAAMVGGVGMSLCRQVGKTYLLGAMLFVLAILRPGLLIIWTAHHSRTSSETFLAMQAFARRKRIAPYVEAVYKGSGDEAIVFRNGSRILFGARERGFGRGIAGVDVLMCDEAQILTDRALDNMLATLNVSEFGLAIFVGTPPRPEDPSEAFARMRVEALSGESTDTVWIEFGADAGASPDDRRQWAKANPSYPLRTPVESILRLRKKLTPESFLREGMGVWDEDYRDTALPGWTDCAVESARLPKRGLTIGLSVSLDRSWGSIGVAAQWRKGRVIVGANDRRPGTDWLVDRVSKLYRKTGCGVAIDERGPAAVLIPDLDAAGVPLVRLSTSDYLDACMGLFDRVKVQTIAHIGSQELDDAVDGASKRLVGDSGRWAWGRKASAHDISMLEAVTIAAWDVWTTPDYDVLDSVH